MAFPRNSLRAFLTHAKTNLQRSLQQQRKVTLVIGNESADLDSLTSSILYAYIRSQAPPPNAFTPLYIPLLNIPAKDVALRPEFEALFRHANITASHLITLDDLGTDDSIGKRLRPENSRWILVDHNKLVGTLGSIYASRVHGVVDHHEDENAVPRNTDPEPRIIDKCGSCTSLAVKYLQSSWDTITGSSLSSGAGHAQGDSLVNDDAVSRLWDAQVGKMTLASILIDTRDLTDESKVTKVDEDAAAYLISKIKLSPEEASTWDCLDYFKAIDSAKKNIDRLSLDGILRKDYKQWQESELTLGMSSVVKPLHFLAAKAQSEQSDVGLETAFDISIESFIRDRNLDLFAIMTTFTSSDGSFQRELLLQSTDRGMTAAQRFEKQASVDLGLEHQAVQGSRASDHPVAGLVWRRVWSQKDVGKSRKQVAPLLRKAMQSN